MRLTETKVRNAKEQPKDYRLTDGHGLHLFVKTNGAKLWRWRYEFEGKEKLMSIGVYPDVTLKAARDAHETAWQLLACGINTMMDRKEKEEQAKRGKIEAQVACVYHPFRNLANDWFEW